MAEPEPMTFLGLALEACLRNGECEGQPFDPGDCAPCTARKIMNQLAEDQIR